MKMRKILALILMACFIMAGCSNNAEDKTYDEAFLKDFVKGLSARWDLAENPSLEIPENEQNTKCVQVELDKISSYPTKKFADTQLQEKAISYVNLLNAQKEALSYYSVDYDKYLKLWNDAYDKRSQMIKHMIETYNLEFPEKYSEILKKMLTNAKEVNNKDELESKVKQMTESIVFSKVNASGSYSYYEAIVENITDKTFESFSVDISLLDAEGVILESQYSSVSNFAPGKKAKLEFMTDTKFETYELTTDYYIKEE